MEENLRDKINEDVECLTIIKELYPINYGVCGDYNKYISKIYRRYGTLKTTQYRSGRSLNGWVIPKEWNGVHAELRNQKNKVVWKTGLSKLEIAYLSPNYTGKVTREELIKHTCYREDFEEAVVYDWTRLYRIEERQKWGLCIPFKDVKELNEMTYDVKIKTISKQGKMQVHEIFIKGECKKEYIINAHNCHPYQANDDQSGVAIALLLARFLRNRNNYYSYRILLCPELFGPMFWLKNRKARRNKDINGTILLKSLANDGGIKIQRCYDEEAQINKTINNIGVKNIERYKYREYYGNDEIVFESPPYKIPSITLTRYPFKEYHTNMDTPEKISIESLNESLSIVKELIIELEYNRKGKLTHSGVQCLSSLGLYMPAIAPGIDDRGQTNMEVKQHKLMNMMPRMIDEGSTIEEISNAIGLPSRTVYDYVRRWEKKGLIKMMPVER